MEGEISRANTVMGFPRRIFPKSPVFLPAATQKDKQESLPVAAF